VQSNFITQLLNLKGIKVTKISHGNSLLRSILQPNHENILVLLVALKPLEFMIIENKQLRIYLYSLSTPTLYFAKEGMFALVERGL